MEHFVALVQDVSEQIKKKHDLQESKEELRRLSQRLVEIREDEKTLLSQEVHDQLGQGFTALKLGLSNIKADLDVKQMNIIKQIEALESIADESVIASQRICSDLKPRLLDLLGLDEAIKVHIEEFQSRFNIHCDLFLEDNLEHVSNKMAINLYRILQESLTNVARHSSASKVEVSIDNTEKETILNIKDNGIGFDTNIKKPKSTGLIGMRERVLSLSGHLSIISNINKGTSVKVTIPKKIN